MKVKVRKKTNYKNNCVNVTDVLENIVIPVSALNHRNVKINIETSDESMCAMPDNDVVFAKVNNESVMCDSIEKQQEIQRQCFIKKLFKFLFTGVRKTKTNGSALLTIRVIMGMACAISAFLGYAISILFIVSGIITFCQHPSWPATLALLILIGVALVIALVSKFIAASGVDIEENNDKDIVISVAAFWLAFWPVAKDIIGYIIECKNVGG